MIGVEAPYPSWCMTDETHTGFVTDGTGMLLCAECGGGCETDFGKCRHKGGEDRTDG